MWDLIVSVPDHCLSFYFTIEPEGSGELKYHIKKKPETNRLCCRVCR